MVALSAAWGAKANGLRDGFVTGLSDAAVSDRIPTGLEGLKARSPECAQARLPGRRKIFSKIMFGSSGKFF